MILENYNVLNFSLVLKILYHPPFFREILKILQQTLKYPVGYDVAVFWPVGAQHKNLLMCDWVTFGILSTNNCTFVTLQLNFCKTLHIFVFFKENGRLSNTLVTLSYFAMLYSVMNTAFHSRNYRNMKVVQKKPLCDASRECISIVDH
jgi:hypothetical protein